MLPIHNDKFHDRLLTKTLTIINLDYITLNHKLSIYQQFSVKLIFSSLLESL